MQAGVSSESVIMLIYVVILHGDLLDYRKSCQRSQRMLSKFTYMNENLLIHAIVLASCIGHKNFPEDLNTHSD